jgi:uncharacterized low-complexity protein
MNWLQIKQLTHKEVISNFILILNKIVQFQIYNVKFYKPKLKVNTMNKINKTLIISASLMILSLNVSAHDASMHTEKAVKADCTGYNKMMESNKKMDMTDPVMLAMMKKCKNQAASHNQHEEKNADKKCGDMKDSAKKGDKKCGDMKEADHKQKKEGKCGDGDHSDK